MTQAIRSLPQLQLSEITRQDLLEYFENTWALTEVLFSSLQGPQMQEAFTRAPAHGLRHPLIFYYGHPAVLYINKLRVAGLLDKGINSSFESLFEVGVDEMSWDDMSKNDMIWPPVSEVTEYRRQVYQTLRELILQDPRLDPLLNPILPSSPAWALVMGFEHERIHFETSSVLIRELPLKYVVRPREWPPTELEVTTERQANSLLDIPAGPVQLGKPKTFPSFGWDNEYGHQDLQVPAFRTSSQLIGNGEFLEFVVDGGYREPRFWSDEGWSWRKFRNAKAPAFWVADGPAGLHQYKIRIIFEEVEFQPEWPAIVNFHEAQAYCKWRTWRAENKKPEKSFTAPFRLLTEPEHHRLRQHAQSAQPGGDWNLGLKLGHEVSTSRFARNGLADVFGNVWQWCEDRFHPLPGFEPHAYYEDFSTPCFDGRHQMIMGGSFASTGDEAEAFARFHFRPHFYQHAGFRVVQSLLPQSMNYESTELLSQYLLLHFASSKDVYPYDFGPVEALSFPQTCARVVIEACQKWQVTMGSVLDVGCAVGGSSFALSESFLQVTGVDLSASFIAAAQSLKSEEISYSRKDQGGLSTSLVARRPANSQPERLRFLEADACALPTELAGFDAVLMANLLCRLPNPRACLRSMAGDGGHQDMHSNITGAKHAGVVRPGGLLILVSPYSWLSEYTAPEHWLGGQTRDGARLESSEEIKKVLEPDFELLSQQDLPLLIREHARKYQYIVSHLMIWRRKA